MEEVKPVPKEEPDPLAITRTEKVKVEVKEDPDPLAILQQPVMKVKIKEEPPDTPEWTCSPASGDSELSIFREDRPARESSIAYEQASHQSPDREPRPETPSGVAQAQQEREQLHSASCSHECQGQATPENSTRMKRSSFGRDLSYKGGQCACCLFPGKKSLVSRYLPKRKKVLPKNETEHTEERSFTCDKCGASFTKRLSLYLHMVKIHPAGRLYNCETCGESFKQQNDLTRHILTHKEEHPDICNICGKSFAHQAGLKRHRRSHTVRVIYRCEQCGAGFNYKSNYAQHNELQHGVKQYKCDLCPAHFRYNYCLVIHRRSHTGERPFKCPHCSAGFCSEQQMRAHITNRHRGHKNVCNKCDRRVFKKAMKKHIKICSGRTVEEKTAS